MQKQLLLIPLLMCGAVNAAAVSAAASKKADEGKSPEISESAINLSKIFSKTASQQVPEAGALAMLGKLQEYAVLVDKLFRKEPDHQLTGADWVLLKANHPTLFAEMTPNEQTLAEDRFRFAAAKAWRQKHGKATGPDTAEEAHQG